ncbi:MAG: pseudouridine synthase [Gemmatimonadaceae bacterium]
MRIQRALARAGIAARRKAESLVTEGRVTVNGVVASIGQVVEPGRDRILVDGVPLPTITVAEWFVLNKPVGVLTSRGDADGRPTIFELVPSLPGLTYVGRLDYMTEGVLLLTTDGAAAHALTHPSREVERVYVATVRGNATGAAAQARRGVELEDGLVIPKRVEARSIGHRRWELELVLTEGRTREVRRLCEALGLDVERLVRTRYGPIELGKLPPGEVRTLSAREKLALRAATRVHLVDDADGGSAGRASGRSRSTSSDRGGRK